MRGVTHSVVQQDELLFKIREASGHVPMTTLSDIAALGGELAGLCEDPMGHNGSRAHGSLHDHIAVCACLFHQIKCP